MHHFFHQLRKYFSYCCSFLRHFVNASTKYEHTRVCYVRGLFSSHRASTIFLLQLFWHCLLKLLIFYFLPRDFILELCASVVLVFGNDSAQIFESPIKTSQIIVINSSKDIFRHYGNTTSKKRIKQTHFGYIYIYNKIR